MLSSYNPQDRYRRKAMDRMAGVFTVFILIGLSFGIGFWFGKQSVGQAERSLKQQVKALEAERAELQDEMTEVRAEAQTANMRYSQLQETYKETIPEGPMQDLVLMLKKQVEEGKSPERLAFLIRSARPPRNCSEPQTRRFIVSTPAYKGPGSKISIADGALIVSGRGSSAMNSRGQPEAWFDPSKKITVDFAASGEKETRSSTLPIKHSIVVGDREYRLNIANGPKSFAKVTYDSCDYP